MNLFFFELTAPRASGGISTDFFYILRF